MAFLYLILHMNLYIFPEAASKTDGYGIGVEFAYKKLAPRPEDIVVWLSTYDKSKMLYLRDNDIVIPRNKVLSYKSISNIVKGRNRSEVTSKDLSFLLDYDFENIHCDEVIFHKALRDLFPNKQFCVRLHNCFSRILVRNQFLDRKIGLKYSTTLKLMTTLEKEVFSDRNVYKIFISDEDRDFYCSTYGIYSDSETWQYTPNKELMFRNRKPVEFSNKLVWFGGIESHKESSVQWFISEVLPKVQQKLPDVEFHLWGRNTQRFNNQDKGVFGHGFFIGEGMPLYGCLYVNPDIIGGGIKLKLMTLMENGIPFISTPFGFEGYSKDLVDNDYCMVVEDYLWADYIVDKLSDYTCK